MALQTSGPISLNDIHIEAGGNSGTQCAINNTDIRGLIGKDSGVEMSFNEWYGAANAIFDHTQHAAVYGRTVNSNNATYGNGYNDPNTWYMQIQGASGVTFGSTSENLLSDKKMELGKTYDIEYRVSLSGSNTTSNRIVLAMSYSALTGFQSSTQTSGALNQIYQVTSGPGTYSGTYRHTVSGLDQYFGLMLFNGTQGNGNPYNAQCSVTKLIVKEV